MLLSGLQQIIVAYLSKKIIERTHEEKKVATFLLLEITFALIPDE